jgi:phage gp29-like protein
MKSPVLLDAYGRAFARQALTQEVAGPTLGGVRSPISGYPGDGLNPLRLANILREADIGDPIRYLELAETIEERDLHYQGVLGTRRRAVSQIEVKVDAASDSPEHEKHAQLIRNWLKRDELQDELFDILDAVAKGYSFTEVTYDHSEGQYSPRLERRDQRWFRFDRRDLSTPMLITENGQEEPLTPGKFIFARMQAKSGLPMRSGIARGAAWAWMFKAFSQRDWAIFSQTYGQPVRVGKFGPGASDQDKATLFRAVANIAGDCAAIIPESMSIDFIESGNVGAGHSMYKERCDWIDMQISKAVLGQTATTDAVTGGLGSGSEHGDVRKDIKRADARALAATLNRDLVPIWVQMEFGPQAAYPRLRIEEPEEEDLKALSEALGPLIDRGLEVEQATILSRFGLPEPKSGAKLLRPEGAGATPPDPSGPNSKIKRVLDVFKRVEPLSAPTPALQAEGALAAKKQGVSAEDLLADQAAIEAAPAMDAMVGKIEDMFNAAGSLEELRAMLTEGFGDLPSDQLAQVLAQGFILAELAGRADVSEDVD